MSSLAERIDLLELDLRRVERELAALRREAAAGPTFAEPEVRIARPPAAPPVRVPPPRPTPQSTAPSAQSVPPRPRRESPRIDVGEVLARFDLLGARGLAIAGGSVTALGITLLFALAAERGWIGPLERVAAGALVSALVFGAGLVAHRRYGQVVAGLAAVGAGIAGGYATLAAAAALYELVPDPAALAIAAAIAGVAVVVSLAWGSELVAALGLIGAALAPALEAADTEIGAIGLAFGVVVLAATSTIAVHRRWELLLVAVLGVVGAEAVWLVFVEAGSAAPETLAVIATLAAVLLATACAWQVTGGERAVARLAGPMVLADLGFLLLSGQALLDAGSDRGAWLAFAACSFALFWVAVRSAQPDFALLLAASSLALAAVAVANFVSGDGLTLSWAAQSVVLTALAYRFRDARLQLAAIAYLGLATVHLVGWTDPLGELFRADAAWSTAIPAVAVGVAAAAAGLLAPRAYVATGEVGALAFVASIRAALLRRRAGTVETLLAGATALGVVAFGILVVSLDVNAGHLALSCLAALAAVAGTVVASARRAPGLAAASLAASFVVAAETAAYDLDELSASWAGPSLLLAATGLLASGVLLRVRWTTPAPLGLASGAAAITAFVAAFAALDALVPDDGELTSRLWATVGSAVIATVYLSLAGQALRQRRLRNLATTLWSLGLVALLVAELVATHGGQAFAITVAVTATVTAVVAYALRELRLWIAAAVLLAGDCAGVLVGLTPPEHLLAPNAAPASGVVALVAVAAATVAVALTAPHHRRWLLAGAAGLGLYGLSLVVLEVAIRVSGASLEADFERGHTVVSAVWGLTGLAVLVAGLSRRSNELRYAGLALFGLTLAKIFLFDLSELSSIARAASFVAVGGALLAGGLLVQRLGEREADILER